MAKVVRLSVGMTCSGCSGAVTRILSKISGIRDIDANVDAKTVRVLCDHSVDEQSILQALQKWAAASGRMVKYIESINVDEDLEKLADEIVETDEKKNSKVEDKKPEDKIVTTEKK